METNLNLGFKMFVFTVVFVVFCVRNSSSDDVGNVDGDEYLEIAGDPFSSMLQNYRISDMGVFGDEAWTMVGKKEINL
ncbi:mannan endo-1,4-beta-mannosidase [Ranunculus cassubicifolius]